MRMRNSLVATVLGRAQTCMVIIPSHHFYGDDPFTGQAGKGKSDHCEICSEPSL